MESRYRWKDITSGIVIYLIWVAHLGDYSPGRIRPFIVFFANPIFFMIGGFFAQSSQVRPVTEMLKRNAKRLLLPYFVWGAINIGYYSLLNDRGGVDYFIQNLTHLLQCDVTKFEFGGSAWFLIGIFEARVIYDLMRRRIKNSGVLCLITLAINLLMTFLITKGYPILNSGYLRGIYWLFFYSLGPLLFPLFNKLKQIIQNWNEKAWNVKCLFGVVFTFFLFIMATVYLYGEDVLIPFNNRYIREIETQLFLPLCLSIGLIWLTLFFNQGFWERIGQMTLLLCVSESMIKSLSAQIIHMVGLSLDLSNPVVCLIYILAIFWIVSKIRGLPYGNKRE